jgi:hypothetical protein
MIYLQIYAINPLFPKKDRNDYKQFSQFIRAYIYTFNHLNREYKIIW